ncbi:fizzy-related protein homolog [Folsomia candida]|uniref:Fizzy-related protein n=1 Tax=Folsomia candida TaxID=158441 RepID=A0A226CYR1_FOLCA|nr:fizzy-related protein homolog [Folsomia candida]OXA37617.1 Fizzy-related protein [Folsomia candida]
MHVQNHHTPPKPRHGDRFIPIRAGKTWESFPMISPPSSSSSLKLSKPGDANNRSLGPRNENLSENNATENDRPRIYASLLKNEVLGDQIDDCGVLTPQSRVTPSRRLFNFDSSERTNFLNSPSSPYSLSPISPNSAQLLQQRFCPPAARKISKYPFKLIFAPTLSDDFYLHLVDWSAQDVLAVSLESYVYLWSLSAVNGNVVKLCEIGGGDTVTSVAWNEKGTQLAVGTHTGLVQIWDVTTKTLLTSIWGHSARVGVMAWSEGGNVISTGSKDCSISESDLREHRHMLDKRRYGHLEEVCGLAWSPDNEFLASGGGDGRVNVWNRHFSKPVHTYTEHTAAVKAIAWSPHHHGLLASGGGTADQKVRFWNTAMGQEIRCVPMGSQICNLAWSKHSQEFVTTHGFSGNNISIWNYPSCQQVDELRGHYDRVLYMSMSPSGEDIVTGAGDGRLKLWKVFRKGKPRKERVKSRLSLYDKIR